MESLRLVTTLPVSPAAVFEAWLTAAGHTAMTGSPAASEPRVGTRHTAWDGYISGRQLELEPGKRILQSWRTTEFPANAPDSRLEIRLVAVQRGSRLTLLQSGIPDGQSEMYSDGWQEHYFVPMQRYFRQAGARAAGVDKKRKKAASKKRIGKIVTTKAPGRRASAAKKKRPSRTRSR